MAKKKKAPAQKKKSPTNGKPVVGPEIAGLLFAFLAAFLFVAVFSFNPQDPTFNQSINPWKVDNMAGSAGAYVAGLLVEFFGMGAVLFPFLFLYLALSRFIPRIRITTWQWMGVLGLFALLVAWAQHPWFAPEPARTYDLTGGGMLGRFANGHAVEYLKSAGTFLVWLFLTLACVHLTFNISLAVEGRRIRNLASALWCAFKENRERRAKLKALRELEKDKEEVVDFPEPPPVNADLIMEPFTSEPDDTPPAPSKPIAKRRPRSKSSRIAFPGTDLLAAPPKDLKGETPEDLRAQAERLTACLRDFNIHGDIQRVMPGPVVTMFEYKPAPGVKISRIAALSDDIALALKALAVRIVAPIPGKDSVGVEIPNTRRQTVFLREILEYKDFKSDKSPLTLALGKDIQGRPKVADLSAMPHLLVAGATGKGKSVFLNSALLSLLYKATPDQLKLLLVDPKRIELAVYAKLPHLVHPVVTDMAMAKSALEWATHEMDRRYEDMSRLGVRNIEAFNKKLLAMDEVPEDLVDLEPMPLLVIVIDELADLMMTASKEVEMSIVRLAQLARASGIHMILATQRPSVDVVTGLIKANFPTRVSFQVSSKHDSRTILDTVGSERLLGMGDMLYKPGGASLQRLHGAFVDDAEIAGVVDFWQNHHEQQFELDFSQWQPGSGGSEGGTGSSGDPVYDEAVAFVRTQGKASISLIQRRFRIGFNRAARYIEQMEDEGLLGPQEGSKPRAVIK